MPLASLQEVSLSRSGKSLLENVTFSVDVGERVLIFGRNGVGKSSLLHLLAGTLQPDKGEVVYSAGTRFGLMPQEVPLHWSGPIFCVAVECLGEEGKALAAAYAASSTHDFGFNAKQLDQGHEYLESGAGWDRYTSVLSVLSNLGLNPDTDFSTLSGGSRRRVALARALLSSNDLILDEPTNHLDIKTIMWLEDFLLKRCRTLLFISHDRTFARTLATRIVEVDRTQLYSYACSFDEFLERRELRLENEEKTNASFDKKLAQEEIWIRQGIKARRTRNMGRVRELVAMRKERSQRRERMRDMRLVAQEAERSGKLVLAAEKVGFTYEDGYEVFHDFSAIIQRGDRIGVIGDNGSGKTTLLKVLLGILQPTSGHLHRGTRLEIAYFDQLRDSLDPNLSVMDNVAGGADYVDVNKRRRHVASYLGDFLFPSSRLRVPVSTLSGGERNRLLLAKLFINPTNLLVLDEPTNDLDIETLELLEELLSDYSGTVLLVSHDRSFLDDIVTSTFALEGDKLVHEYVGGYTDWVRQRRTPAQTHSEKAKPVRHNIKERPRKLSFKEQREQSLLQAELDALPDKLAALEQEANELNVKLNEPTFYQRDPKGFTATTERIAANEEEQMLLLERLEEIETRLAQLAALVETGK